MNFVEETAIRVLTMFQLNMIFIQSLFDFE